MKLHARNVAWLLPLLLTACLNKPHPTQIQQYAPPVSTVPKPPILHPHLPESALTLPETPLDTDTDTILDEAAKPVVRHRKPAVKVATEPTDQTPPATANQQTEAENAEVPAIGVLSSSSGDPPDMRQQTVESIAATELGLKSIDRPLNTQEQKTIAQIRQYLSQAKKALTTGDVEGAHTLAAKAKAVLGELTE